ncbi:hypothetical protein [Pontibacter sp. G13]|uniref:hypothetical protein n=1 Tax=Pontibacter sp. G13 TaxID=3074898 RepID=UPI00288BE724|nr:hypothetical protein [Pontibacter sp. G13]WNJ18847.1 hypothetical protein RJD25_28670 [Pontibacter sp. G13]
MKRWKLISIQDPYKKGQNQMMGPQDPTYLVTFRDGGFAVYNQMDYQEGRWAINKTKTKLALIYDQPQQDLANPKKFKPDFRYKISKMTPDSLILQIQGRHGWVTKKYVACEEEGAG